MSVEILVWLLPFLIVSLVLHELAHAYVATWLGDPSPRADGRLSLNPIGHLDPLGTAMFVITALVSDFIKTGEYERALRDSGCAVTRGLLSLVDTFPPLRVVRAEKPAAARSGPA